MFSWFQENAIGQNLDWWTKSSPFSCLLGFCFTLTEENICLCLKKNVSFCQTLLFVTISFNTDINVKAKVSPLKTAIVLPLSSSSMNEVF